MTYSDEEIEKIKQQTDPRHNQWGANAVVEEPDSKFWHRVSNLRKMVDTAPQDMRHIWVTKLRKIMEKVGPKT